MDTISLLKIKELENVLDAKLDETGINRRRRRSLQKMENWAVHVQTSYG